MTAGGTAGRRRFRRTAPAAAPAPGEPRLIGYLYVLPAFVVFAVFVIAPMVDGAWISLFSGADAARSAATSASRTTATS